MKNKNSVDDKFAYENLSKKSKTLMLLATVFGALGAVVLVVSSILQLIFDLQVISVGQKFSMAFNLATIIGVLVLLIASFVFYKLFKNSVLKSDESEKSQNEQAEIVVEAEEVLPEQKLEKQNKNKK